MLFKFFHIIPKYLVKVKIIGTILYNIYLFLIIKCVHWSSFISMIEKPENYLCWINFVEIIALID